MKSIINGTRYDTDKATLIGETDNIGKGASSMTDFKWWEAGLYVTPRSGRYFIAGRGGAMSRFSRKIDSSSWRGGEAIVPMSEEEAFEWAQHQLPESAIEQHFAHLIKDA